MDLNMTGDDLKGAAAILATGLGVAKPVIETGCTLIENLLGRPAKVAGNLLADEVYAWQWANRVRIAHRAKEIMDADSVAARVVPRGFLLPLVDAAGNVEDPDLQEMWAQLIASGVADNRHQHPGFVATLRMMDGADARQLRQMIEEWIPVEDRPMLTSWEEAAELPEDPIADRLEWLGLVINVAHLDRDSAREPTGYAWQFAQAVMPRIIRPEHPES